MNNDEEPKESVAADILNTIYKPFELIAQIVDVLFRALVWVFLFITSPIRALYTNGDIRLFTFRNIPVFLSPGFVIYQGVLALMTLMATGYWSVFDLLATQGTLYTLVTIHEFGHSLTAVYFGYQARSITLYPLAGIASLDGDWHKDPPSEFWIILNGPLTNFAMALMALPLVYWIPDSKLIANFFEWNVIMLGFNMLPVFPMDGGRIVRCWLTRFCRGDYVLSTKYAAIWTGGFLVVAAPALWMYFNPVAAILISVMGLLGWGEYFGLKRLREKEESKEEFSSERIDKLIRAAAKAAFPFDSDKEEEHYRNLKLVDKFVEEVMRHLYQRNMPGPDDSIETQAEKTVHEIQQVFKYIKSIPEESRIKWNVKFNLADTSDDGGQHRAKVMSDFLDAALAQELDDGE